MVAVVAKGEVAARRDCEFGVGRAQVAEGRSTRTGVRVAAVTALLRHHAAEHGEFGDCPVDVEVGRGDAESLPGHAGEALDVVLRTHGGVEAGFDFADAGGFENEDFAEPRLGEVVAGLVHEDLVAGVHVPAGDDLAGGVFAPGEDAEVAHEGVAGHEERVALVAANDVREGEKIQDGPLLQRDHDIAFLRPQVEVVASAENEVEGAHGDVWRRGVGGDADDSEEGRLHGPGGDAEGLEEKRLHARRNHDGDKEDLDVLAEAGVFQRRHGVADELVGGGDLFGDFGPVALFHRGADLRGLRFDLRELLGGEDVALVGEEFFYPVEVVLRFLDVSRG